MSYFLPYQNAWCHDPSPLRLCAKGRQIGLTYVDAYDSVRKAAQAGGRDVWVMSRDEAQAKQYLRQCKGWARILGLAADEHGEPLFARGGAPQATVQTLTFASRASIFALSSNPDAIVGKSGHVKLDEFALHRNQRILYAVAKPVTQWGGTLSIISTHRGAHTVFNQIIHDIKQRGNPMNWSLHEIPVQKAVDQGLVEKINERTARQETRAGWLARQQAECIDHEQWLQEYCCVPADESVAFITFEMIAACEDPELRLLSLEELDASLQSSSSSLPAPARRDEVRWSRESDEPRSSSSSSSSSSTTSHSALRTPPSALYLGLDVARKRDLCVLDVGEKIGDVVWDHLRLELQGRPFSEIEAALYRLLRLPAVKRACLDASGLGLQLAERAAERFPWKIEPITFTAPVKEELAYGLRADFEDRKLRLVEDDRLRADLRGIRKEVSLSGNIRFAGESHDSHCDRFWAKALRQQAARYRPQAGGAVA